jgi:hypothetical protein
MSSHTTRSSVMLLQICRARLAKHGTTRMGHRPGHRVLRPLPLQEEFRDDRRAQVIQAAQTAGAHCGKPSRFPRAPLPS